MAAVVSGGRSTLNPDAPMFIPAAYRQVEDFSPEWWQLVNTTTWFKDYWLSQHQEQEGYYNNVAEEDSDLAGLLPDTFDLDVVGDDFASFEAQFDEFVESYEAEKMSPRALPSYGNGYGIGGGAGGMEAGFRAGITATVGSPKFGY
ncbi:unnamed protein product [Linum tenue]|uniref:Protein EARLY RESPONSIVE TO DEHYDRATION 15 n=2 Tax=Linum TaxID=4005 RepID=A0AAV0GQY7_9ROSI|nr:unnamed protein product [Linum tenue]